MTNVIKLKYLRGGELSGREYTFYTPERVEVGEMVDICKSEKAMKRGIVTSVDVPLEEILPFGARATTILGRSNLQADATGAKQAEMEEKRK